MNAMHHIYLRCKDHGVLFYTVEDRIVYYTLAACKAKKYGIKVHAASLMFTHLHQSIVANSRKDLRSYLQDTNSAFSRLYNHHYKRTGKLFDKPPGQSCKTTLKNKRSNIIYVYNNHVEKGLCSRAVQERWSFLAYAISSAPFSHAIIPGKISQSLQKAMSLARRRAPKLQALEYNDLDKIFGILTETEKEQYIDYVISLYAWIDFSSSIAYFGTLEALIVATDSTTGGEYDIREDYSKLKDRGYVDLVEIARMEGFMKDIYSMSDEEKADRIIHILSKYHIDPGHLMKFFHKKFKIS